MKPAPSEAGEKGAEVIPVTTPGRDPHNHEHRFDPALRICEVCGLTAEGARRGHWFHLRIDLLKTLRERSGQ